VYAALGLAAALGFLLLAGVLCCAVAGEDAEPLFTATLGLATALGLSFFGERASWIAVVGGDPRTPFSAVLGRAAVLDLAFFGVRASWTAVVGRDSRTHFFAALGMATALGCLLRMGVLCCVVAGGDP
jgi:hypothetical protein